VEELAEQALIAEIDRRSVSTPDEFRAELSTEAVHLMLAQRIAAFPHISGLSLRDLSGEIVNASLDRPSSRGRLEPNPADMLAAQLFTLRQVRLTTSLPTVPPNSAASARRTRRVLVPARYVLAISASAASVRR
jgi:hypothetical protein